MELVTVKNFDTLENKTYAYQVKDASEVEISLDQDGTYEFVVEEGIKANAFITIKQTCKDVKIAIKVKANAKINVFVLNEAKDGLVKEEHVIEENGKLQIAYGDLEGGNNKHQANYKLVGAYSDVEVKMAYINDNADKKDLEIDVEHLSPATISDVEVYGVMKKEAKFKADVVGRIIKGAKQSECHQATRILNFDKNVSAKAEPILLIDENDVKASHACSMGTVDENHLYYLESRGLTPSDAVALIVSGYLAVLATVFEKDELKEKVANIIVEKAGV